MAERIPRATSVPRGRDGARYGHLLVATALLAGTAVAVAPVRPAAAGAPPVVAPITAPATNPLLGGPSTLNVTLDNSATRPGGVPTTTTVVGVTTTTTVMGGPSTTVPALTTTVTAVVPTTVPLPTTSVSQPPAPTTTPPPASVGPATTAVPQPESTVPPSTVPPSTVPPGTASPETSATVTVPEPTTTVPVPVTDVPAAAAVAPPIGEEMAPSVVPIAVDPVAAAAQLTYDAFVPWRAAGEARVRARNDVRAVADDPDATPEQQAAAADALLAAQAALSSAAPVYRAARDALADAVMARAGRAVSAGARLSAVWERTDPKRLAVVFVALMHVGDPYVFGMSGPDQFDCSGLTRAAWRTVGVDLVHYAITQRQQSLDVTVDGLQAGDLAFRFRRPGGHVMLYLGIDDLVVQAGGTATGVVVTPWGSVDALGSPLAAPAPPDPEAPPSASSFGRAARSRLVDDDIPFGDAFNAAGAQYEVAPVLLAAIASVTGGYRPETEMGLRPAVVADMGLDEDDPYAVIDGAAERLVDLYLLLGDERAALAAYPTSLGAATDITAVPDDPVTTAFVDAVEAAVRASPS